MTSYAFLFPGQGSQAVGMGRELYAGSPAAKAIFDEADDALGMKLSTLCFDGPAEALTLTANTQPAILTTSMAALAALREATAITPTVALGHSLGEFCALVAVGALRFADAVKLVRLRGQAMQEAVPARQGAMAAVMGLAADEVEALCEAAAQGQVVSPANFNGAGQIVIAGHADAVARAVAAAKDRKARAIPLDVSAPFHCALMQPAADRLAEALKSIEIGPMAAPVISNVDAEPNADPAAVAGLLVRQVTHRVRWEASVQRAVAMGAEDGLEIGHGRRLAGLLRRIKPKLSVRPVGSPGDVDVLKGGTDGAK